MALVKPLCKKTIYFCSIVIVKYNTLKLINEFFFFLIIKSFKLVYLIFIDQLQKIQTIKYFCHVKFYISSPYQ